jgi:hypothetical protein
LLQYFYSSPGNQGDGATPTGTIDCQLETESGAYFCGIAGADCTSGAFFLVLFLFPFEADLVPPRRELRQRLLHRPCWRRRRYLPGWLRAAVQWKRRPLLGLPLLVSPSPSRSTSPLTSFSLTDCLSSDFELTTGINPNTCGAQGAFCQVRFLLSLPISFRPSAVMFETNALSPPVQDPIAVDPTLSTAAAQLIFDQFCASGYCSSRCVFSHESPSPRRFPHLS